MMINILAKELATGDAVEMDGIKVLSAWFEEICDCQRSGYAPPCPAHQDTYSPDFPEYAPCPACARLQREAEAACRECRKGIRRFEDRNRYHEGQYLFRVETVVVSSKMITIEKIDSLGCSSGYRLALDTPLPRTWRR